MYRVILIVLGMCSVSCAAFGCTQLPAGTSLWIRLSQPVSSYSAKPGMPVAGFLLESPTCDGVSMLPAHVPVEGWVVSVHRVGLGLVHETANLEIEFSRIVPQQGAPIEIHGRVHEVDNAREDVKNGVIHGIRSTDTPQGEISSRLKYLPSLHLYPDPYLLGFKLLFPVFPEPEIYLPPGTDLLVELQDKVELPGELVPPPPLPRLQDDEQQSVAEVLHELPTRTLDRKSRQADLINMAFIGSSREELAQAFQDAGWQQSDAVSRQSVARQFRAFLTKSSYATAPMSRQFFDGRPPDLTLEKTFDSYGRRDHLRLWKLESTVDNVPLWVGAAVRETGATLSVARMGFMHHVSDDLEEEQRAIQRHLLAADCVDSVSKVDRPGMATAMINATGEVLRTDGSVTVLRLKACSAPTSSDNALRFRPGSKFSRYLRKDILTVRSDLLRANCIYALYRAIAATTTTVRHMSARRADIRSVHVASARIPASGPESRQSPVETHLSEIGSWLAAPLQSDF